VDQSESSGVLRGYSTHLYQLDERKLTFTIIYKEFRISLSSSVPKMADICDMGLYLLSDKIPRSSANKLLTKGAMDQCVVLYEGIRLTRK
jgi:hypothetical protein